MYTLNIRNGSEVDQNSVLVRVFCVVVHARILKILQQLLPLLTMIIVIKLKQAERPAAFAIWQQLLLLTLFALRYEVFRCCNNGPPALIFLAISVHTFGQADDEQGALILVKLQYMHLAASLSVCLCFCCG